MFHYSKAILRVGGRLLATYFFTLRKWAKHIERYPREKRFIKIRKIINAIARALQTDIYAFGLENVPVDRNYYMVCNHMSGFDPIPFIIKCDKRPLTFVGKSELKKAPFLPAAMSAIEGDYIDRDNLRQSLKVMLKVEDDLKKGEMSWMLFPEGTRRRDQLLPVGEFHHGSFRPPVKAQVPIVPAAIYGSFRVLKTHPQFKRYPVFISILKPLMPEDYASMNTAEIAELVRNNIQREVTYHLRPLDHKTMSERKYKKYRFNHIY